MGNLGYGHFFLISSLFNKTYISILIFFSQSRKERKARKWHLFPTKTGKTIAVMQGLCPLFLSGAVVLRSKFRPAGTGKKQPSFLRLASRQGKPGKPLTPRFLLSLFASKRQINTFLFGLSTESRLFFVGQILFVRCLRTALNPTCPPLPMVHVGNPLIINVLHASA
ncbi:hypothetical protein [Prevotella lacticifex]|uniref:hypothetical protein n=1 Tax=Prevotella lacticifex TaxID=2854755 RepID=UPI001CC3B74A|nr:hypothetical protein [Prevotella lacticifex]